MGRTSCEYNWHSTGKQIFYDNSTFETLDGMYPICFKDDFEGADLVISDIAIAAQGTITMAGIAIADETFVIDTQTFTWKAARGGTGEVTIGGSAAAAVTNIVTAITADLPTVTSVDGAGNTVVITVVLRGSAGNSIVFTEASTNMAVDGAGTLGTTTSGTDVESGAKWAKKTIQTGGSPTIIKKADEVNGIIELDLDNDAELMTAALNMDDQLVFSMEQGLIFEARINMSVLPSGAVSRGIFGMGGPWVAEGAAHRVGFEILQNGVCNAEEDDAVNDRPGSTGVTIVAGTFNIFRIDCTTISDVKFFIDGARVAASTTFNNASSTANRRVQPYFEVTKTGAAADQATLELDYIKIFQNRS